LQDQGLQAATTAGNRLSRSSLPAAGALPARHGLTFRRAATPASLRGKQGIHWWSQRFAVRTPYFPPTAPTESDPRLSAAEVASRCWQAAAGEAGPSPLKEQPRRPTRRIQLRPTSVCAATPAKGRTGFHEFAVIRQRAGGDPLSGRHQCQQANPRVRLAGSGRSQVVYMVSHAHANSKLYILAPGDALRRNEKRRGFRFPRQPRRALRGLAGTVVWPLHVGINCRTPPGRGCCDVIRHRALRIMKTQRGARSYSPSSHRERGPGGPATSAAQPAGGAREYCRAQ
jgi:hypothetical protein